MAKLYFHTQKVNYTGRYTLYIIASTIYKIPQQKKSFGFKETGLRELHE